MLKYLISCSLLLSCGIASAQDAQPIPTFAEMEGDYIIMNYKEYSGQTFLSDMKAMRIDTDRDGLKISGFYISESEDFIAGYDTATGTISIPAGTKILGGDSGFEQYLYLWDDEREEIRNTDIKFTFQEDGSWKVSSSIVMMSGIEGGELSPYYFSNGTVIRRANARTSNVSYVGWGSEQEMYIEERPSYIEIVQNKITVYNLLQKDQYGYGCNMGGTFTSDGKTLFNPSVIGQTNDGIYKVLAGCIFDAAQNKPTDVTLAGERSEGVVGGSVNMNIGLLELEPMAIWTGSEKNGYVTIDTDRRYFEFVKSVKVTFSIPEQAGVESVKDSGNSKEITGIEYYNLLGQRINEPESGSIVIKRTHYKNDSPESEKIYIK